MKQKSKIERKVILFAFLAILTALFVIINRERASIGWFSDGDLITLQTITYIFFFSTMTGTVIVLVRKFLQGGKTSDEKIIAELRKTRLEMRKRSKKGGK